MELNKLAIFTPTYNRCTELEKLYESLCNQSNKKFDWFIIDDGSEDNTKSVVNTWIEEKKIDIHYFYKENGGKHTAFNYALGKVDKFLNVCIDSDDTVAEYMVERILRDFEFIKDNTSIIGLAYPNAYGRIEFKVEKNSKGKVVNVWNISSEIKGIKEAVRVFKPRSLENFRFPEIKGENFFPVEFLFTQISEKGKLLYFPYPLVYGDYQNDGITKNIGNNMLNNHQGYFLSQNKVYDYVKKNRVRNRLKLNGKIVSQLMALNMALKRPLFMEIPKSLFRIPAIPFSIFYYFKRYHH